MNRREYEYLQERLSKLLRKSQYLSRNKEEAYEQGVLAAKSVLAEVYHAQEDDDA